MFDCAPVQMLVFAQQPYLLLSAAVLPFWMSLLQQSAPKGEPATPAHNAPLPVDAAAALLDLAGKSHQRSCGCSHSLRRVVFSSHQLSYTAILLSRKRCVSCSGPAADGSAPAGGPR